MGYSCKQERLDDDDCHEEGEEIQERGVDDDDDDEPVSPMGQYCNSSALSLCILAALESEVPIDDDTLCLTLLKKVFLPISPRFSSIMVTDEQGEKHWKKVTVKLEDHLKVPVFPDGLSPEAYNDYFKEYLTEISMEQLRRNKPLWEVHIFKYPTSSSVAATMVFKLHHSLGDGYSLMGALLTCLKRADDPSLPLTFPSFRSDSKLKKDKKSSVLGLLSVFMNTVTDFSWTFMKSNVLEDHVSPIRSATVGVESKPVSISTVTFSLDQIKQIKAEVGGTINDIVVGIITYGTRLYMDSVSKGSCKLRSTAMVLLNTRKIASYQTVKEMEKQDSKGPWGNHFGFIHVSIPKTTNAETADPLQFVFKTKKMMTRKKSSLAVYLTGRLIDLIRKFKGSETAARYIYHAVCNASLTISNLIGPTEKMSVANYPINGFYFMVVNVPQNLAITMVSYMGKLRICLGADKDLIDHHLFMICLEKAFQKIFEAAVSRPTS